MRGNRFFFLPIWCTRCGNKIELLARSCDSLIDPLFDRWLAFVQRHNNGRGPNRRRSSKVYVLFHNPTEKYRPPRYFNTTLLTAGRVAPGVGGAIDHPSVADGIRAYIYPIGPPPIKRSADKIIQNIAPKELLTSKFAVVLIASAAVDACCRILTQHTPGLWPREC